jgi:NADPH oxidase 2
LDSDILAAFARAAALILIPICRNFISLLRRTPLNQIIQFDEGVAFHKATAWSIVFWTIIHIIAHMVNFLKLALADPQAKGSSQVFVALLSANFATGPGITDWIMTTCLAIMVFFARDGQRRAHFERFWYSHHLFIIFFICWQLHGMFSMIKPDRPPFCSWNQIGLFWVSTSLLSPTLTSA